MKLEEIFQEWTKDSVIDKTDLAAESLKKPNLINKYLKIWSQEKLVLNTKKNNHNKLYHEKWLFYIDGPTKEQIDKGWKFPAKGKILRNDVDRYLDADDDITKSKIQVSIQQEKVDVLNEILRTLHNRSYDIKNALEFMRFMNGES